MNDEERLNKGKEVFKKVYGDVLGLPEPSTLVYDMALMNFFAPVLSRDILSMRDRRLLIFGMLAGLGADASLFEIHLRSGLRNNEIRYDELDDICLLFSGYCGAPRTSPLYSVCQKVLSERPEARAHP